MTKKDLESLIPVAKQYLKTIELLRADNKEFKKHEDPTNKIANKSPQR